MRERAGSDEERVHTDSTAERDPAARPGQEGRPLTTGDTVAAVAGRLSDEEIAKHLAQLNHHAIVQFLKNAMPDQVATRFKDLLGIEWGEFPGIDAANQIVNALDHLAQLRREVRELHRLKAAYNQSEDELMNDDPNPAPPEMISANTVAWDAYSDQIDALLAFAHPEG